ncbi:MAG: transposase [Planctomycetaceae bacterium]
MWQLEFNFLPQQTSCVEPVEEPLSTAAGLLIVRQVDQQRGFTAGFAEQLHETRKDPRHSLWEMVRSRVLGILAGYEDQDDHGRHSRMHSPRGFPIAVGGW